MRRTYKIKIQDISNDDLEDLHITFQQYEHVFNEIAAWGFENKTRSKNRAHKELYHRHREMTDLPSILIQAARDEALEALRGCKFKSQPRRNDDNSLSTMRLNVCSMSLRGNLLTVSKVGKRFRTMLTFPKWCEENIKKSKCRAGQLRLDKRTNELWIHLCVELPNPEPQTNSQRLGIDTGIYHIAVDSDGNFYSSNDIRKIQRKNLYNRKTLQSRGTRSAKRRLRRMAGREKRFVTDTLHVVANQILESTDAHTIVIEDLTNIRRQEKHSYNRYANKHLASWPFNRFRQILEYKAEATGKVVKVVDPRYTSQRCYMCGHINKNNRYKSRFYCVRCSHTNHADINAAKNISTLPVKQESVEQAAGQSADDAPVESKSSMVEQAH